MLSWMRPGPVLALLSCAAVLAGCGGSSGDRRTDEIRTAPSPRTPFDLPAGVPLTGSGTADPAPAQVVRAWATALRGGRVRAASALWAVPSAVQNGTPVLRLRSRRDVRLFNGSLPCGAIVTRVERGSSGFVVVTFRLTDRRGGDCGPGVGGRARTAIRVSAGKIAEWYRLPDAGAGRGPDVVPGPAGPTV